MKFLVGTAYFQGRTVSSRGGILFTILSKIHQFCQAVWRPLKHVENKHPPNDFWTKKDVNVIYLETLQTLVLQSLLQVVLDRVQPVPEHLLTSYLYRAIEKLIHTVDGRNPKQPPGMVIKSNPSNTGVNYQPQLVSLPDF